MIYPKSHSKLACQVLKPGALTPSLEPSFSVLLTPWWKERKGPQGEWPLLGLRAMGQPVGTV